MYIIYLQLQTLSLSEIYDDRFIYCFQPTTEWPNQLRNIIINLSARQINNKNFSTKQMSILFPKSMFKKFLYMVNLYYNYITVC